MEYSDKKLKLHKIMVIQYIKNACYSNTYNNKLKQFLKKKWLEVELSFSKSLSESTIKNNFIYGNQLLLEFNIFTSKVIFYIIINYKIIFVIYLNICI